MRMNKLCLPVLAALTLTSCSDTTATAKKEPPKPPEPVTGQTALFRMYQVARSWAPDAQVLKMQSLLVSEMPDVPRGKAAAWDATFVSAAQSQARSYTFSAIESLPTLHKGVFAGPDEGWSGPRGLNTPFLMAAVKIDTDAAYKTALEHAADYDKKYPGKPITWLLEKNNKYPDPVWRVIWGESLGTSSFSIYIDASIGDFKERMH